MPYDYSRFKHTVFAVDERFRFYHFFRGGKTVVEVAVSSRKLLRFPVARILKIGQINIDVIVHFFDNFGFFVPRCIVHDGYRRTVNIEGFSYFIRIMRGRDEIYIVYAGIDEFFQFVGEIFGSENFARCGFTYFVVLAERTVKTAPRKKDRSAPLFSAYYRLFVKMRSYAANSHLFADFAKPRSFAAVNPAVVRTKIAFH